METIIKPSILLSVTLLIILSCKPGNNESPVNIEIEKEKIRQADIAWSKAAEMLDLEAIVSYYTDDVVVMLPNMPVVVGKEAARELNRSMLDTPGYSAKWEPVKVEVASSGDIGYARGNYVLTINGANGVPVTDKGKYVEIWKKQADGEWKVAVEMFNSDLPAQGLEPLDDESK